MPATLSSSLHMHAPHRALARAVHAQSLPVSAHRSPYSIVHLRSSIGLYGAEHVVLGLAREQMQRGGQSRIVAFAHDVREQPALFKAASAQGIATTALPCHGIVDYRSLRALRTMLIKDPVDIVHCHDYKSVVYARLATQGLGVARVATLHGWLQGSRRLRLYRWLELRALRRFQRVCAVSEPIANTLAAAGHKTRVRRVDNGIDTARFRPASAPRQRHDSNIELGVAARLSPEKNLAQLVHSVAECRRRGKPLRLTIVGDGPLRADLVALVTRLQLTDAVQLPGMLDRLEQWYPRLDAFVLPSLTEGMPMTVLEAMACGCPVVATAVGAIPELLQGLPGSRLIPPGDGAALSEALMQVQALTAPQLALRERVQSRWSLVHMADAYERIYAEASQP
jgi:glycosyltransferase involved in cell wall biosynthesis